MSRFALLTAASAVALSGCGTGGNESAANRTAESRTENGQLSARVQGVDLKIDLPPPLRRMTEDNDFLYPGARTQRGGGDDGQRFRSSAPPETVARWYRDPARANRFTIATVTREGPAYLLAGTARGGGALRIRLVPRAGGGTDGTIVVTAG
jgi:hypothetical protein